MHSRTRRAAVLGGALAATLGTAVARAAPFISEPFASRFQITNATAVGDLPLPVQMAIAPDGRLYVSRNSSTEPVYSYHVDPATGALSDRRNAGVLGFGLAFGTHVVPGETKPQTYMYATRSVNFESTISRYTDTNKNNIWGEAGEVNVDIVRGVPSGDHTMDHMQIHNNRLYVGIGARTNNGRAGDFTGQSFHDEPAGPVPGGFSGGGLGNTYGETSYNGAIGVIRDLTQVPNDTSAAQLQAGPNGTSGPFLAGRDAFLPSAPHAELPYTSTADNKLVVHSAGTRNPFGLAIDSAGALWFTNNHNRADSNGDGTSTPHHLDDTDDNIANDVHDQLFRAVERGDYRYDNTNFRGRPSFPNVPVNSTTFDNLFSSHPNFGQLHDPANPDGLGPSSSANGLGFGTLDLTGILSTGQQDYALVSRWNATIDELPPGTNALTYQDVVIVDPVVEDGETAQVRRLAEGFGQHPIDVISDGRGGFYVAEYWFNETIWHITPRSATSRWNNTGAGSWSSAANWTGPVPDFVGAVANFTDAIQANSAVTVDGPRVLGTMNFDSPIHRYTVGGSTLTIDVAAGFGAINAIRGGHTIAAPVHLAKNTTVNVFRAADTLRMSGDQSAASGVRLTKAGPGTLEVKHLRADHVTLGAGTTRVLPNGTAAGRSNVKSLTIAGGATPSAKLDLSNNALVIDYDAADPSPLPVVMQQIAHAYNGGAWDRNGITSAQANANQFAVGYAEADALTSVPSIFGTVDDTAVLLRLTRYGDADLNGAVNLDDFNRLAANFGQTGRVWSQADFNYDSIVNLDDFNLLAANFGFSAIGPGVTPEDWATLASAVPEPGMTCFALLSTTLLARRLRRVSPTPSGIPLNRG